MRRYIGILDGTIYLLEVYIAIDMVKIIVL